MDDLERRLRDRVRSVPPVSAGEARDRAPAQARADARRRRIALGAGAVLVLTVVGVATVALTRRDRLGVDIGGDANARRYEVDATVIDAGDGPMVCAEVQSSRPPRCGAGWPVQGFDWGEVAFETANGVRWGDFNLVGTWNGHRLVLAAAPGAATPNPPDDSALRSPCPASDAPLDSEAAEQLFAVVQRSPDYAGFWIDPSNGNVNVAFTGDIGSRREQLAATYGDAVCVVPREASISELRTARAELAPYVATRTNGLYMVSVDEAAGVVVAHVAVDDAETRQWIRSVSSRPDLVQPDGFLVASER
jgi:hypothetical protein